MSPRDTATAARSAARPLLERPRLSLVPPLRTSAPRAPFVLLVVALLTSGLACLLYLHTALAEDSFRLHDLKERSAVLADDEQALEQEIAMSASPSRLAARATELGMVRSENPAFIRTSDGRILGRPKPGVAPPPEPVPTAKPASGAERARAGASERVAGGGQASGADRRDEGQRRDRPAGAR